MVGLAVLGLVAAPAVATSAATADITSVASTAATSVPEPTVTGPVQGGVRGYPWNHTTFPLTTAHHDYTEREFLYSGTATDLSDGTTAPYTSRMVVRFPREAAKFNGTVLYDWMNVTDQQDYEFNWWPTAHDYLMRQGYGYVAVTAQRVGANHLKTWDPLRYAPIDHPGDDFSFDIYAQAIRAVDGPSDRVLAKVYPGQAVDVRHSVAGGVSQSAGRLASFINQGYNRDGLVDAYNLERALGSRLDDYSTFIFELNEETSFTGAPAAPRPPDSSRYVVWEEAGAAHENIEWWSYRWETGKRDLVGSDLPPDPVDAGCSVNRAQVGYSVRAMLHHTQRYLRSGTVPPSAPRIPRNADNTPVRDADGLALGGLRQPFVEVPIALNRSSQQDCPFWGTYRPWSDEQVLARYPSKSDYVGQVTAYADLAVRKGWLLRADRDEAVAAAKATSYWS